MFVVQSCPAVCDPMDSSLPGSSVHGISRVRILEWVAISSSRDLPDSGIKLTSSALQGRFFFPPPQRERSVFSLTSYVLKSNVVRPSPPSWGCVELWVPPQAGSASLAHPPAAEQCRGPLEGGISALCMLQGCSWDGNRSSCPRSGKMESTNTQTLMVANRVY